MRYNPLAGVRLMLPAMLPSWRFFDAVTASPRLDYMVVSVGGIGSGRWREFRPRVARLGAGAMVRRLFWNAEWNETLFLVSLAERLVGDHGAATEAHSQRELLLRVARHLQRAGLAGSADGFRIRLRFVGRPGRGEPVTEEVVYRSDLHPVGGPIPS